MEDLAYDSTPHVLFMTNAEPKQPLIDFILETKYVNLYQDVSRSHAHLNDSVQYHQKV